MIKKDELHKITDQIPDEKHVLAKSFLKWLLFKNQTTRKSNRIYLQGITENSKVTDNDIEEVKQIWRSQ